MSRWKFVFEQQERQDNVGLLTGLSEARGDGKAKLLKVYIETTTRCEGKCIHCYFDPKASVGEPPLDELLEMQRFLTDGGVQSLTYAGGDPILRDDHVQLIRNGKTLGLKQTYCTRGWPHHSDKLRAIADEAPDHIQLSCDPDMSGLDIDAELERISLLGKELSGRDIHVSWVTTVTHATIPHIDRILSAVIDSGANEYRLHRVLPWGRFANHPELIPSNDDFCSAVKRTAGHFVELFPKGIIDVEETPPNLKLCLPESLRLQQIRLTGCPVGHTALTVDYQGQVYLCPLCRHDSLRLGDSWRHIFDYWQEFRGSKPFSSKSFEGSLCRDCVDFSDCLGGCRCQAVVRSGELWSMDPTCRLAEE